MQLRPIFSLIRQAVSHASYDDSETRERVNILIDEMEIELDAQDFEFTRDETIVAQKELQKHLVELLSGSMIEDKSDDVELMEVRSAGEITNDDDED